MKKKILVIGGAGYVGSALVPSLLDSGHDVTVYDTFWYGDSFSRIENKGLTKIVGDVRDEENLRSACKNMDAIIHLACISNDPSFELNPKIGKSINLDAFPIAVEEARNARIKRFIYASSSSVYGIREGEVTENAIKEPLTDYSKFKLACEQIVGERAGNMPFVIIRPATVCGYAPRLRLDLAVNTLTISALETGRITVFGGSQLRPNMPIKDMVRAYETLLNAEENLINGQVFNAGYQNLSLNQIALEVQKVIPSAQITHVPTNDLRSYHVNSDKIRRKLGFTPRSTVREAIESLVEAHSTGKIIDGTANSIYHNVKRMKELSVQ